MMNPRPGLASLDAKGMAKISSRLDLLNDEITFLLFIFPLEIIGQDLI